MNMKREYRCELRRLARTRRSVIRETEQRTRACARATRESDRLLERIGRRIACLEGRLNS